VKLCSFLVLAVLTAGASTHSSQNSDDGMEGSIRLGVPEPMIFDLVRPLGARKGEFEVNSLFHSDFRRGHPLEWAPEIEYAFRNGTAVEFELPIEGSYVADYKIALQQRLPIKKTRPVSHGLQGIGMIGRGGHGWSASGLYLVAMRFHPQWSALSMYGAQRTAAPGRTFNSALVNNTLFHERWRKTALGVESNLMLPAHGASTVKLVPQVHFRIVERFNLQFGAGYARIDRRHRPMVSWRLIREL
jgi:hypothetical protein